MISKLKILRSRRLTNAMSTRSLPITFRSELIALVASSRNPPPDWPRGACGPAIAWPRPIWVLAVLVIMASVDLTILMNVDMLLQLLEGVL